MMIYSKILCKDYPTLQGYKIAMGKYHAKMKSFLDDVRICQENGWESYLGMPIHRQIIDLEYELREIKIEYHALTNELIK